MPPRRAAKNIEVPLPIRLDKLTEVLRIRGVPVYVHWSVWAIVVLILFNVIHYPFESLMGLCAYLSVLLIHEAGHLIAAEKMHCEVTSIRLYPIFGVTNFEMPWSKFDHCVIAWRGYRSRRSCFANHCGSDIIWLHAFRTNQCGAGPTRIFQRRRRRL